MRMLTGTAWRFGARLLLLFAAVLPARAASAADVQGSSPKGSPRQRAVFVERGKVGGIPTANFLAAIAARTKSGFTTKAGWEVKYFGLGLNGMPEPVYVRDPKGLTRRYAVDGSGKVTRGSDHQSFRNGAHREIRKLDPGDERFQDPALKLKGRGDGILRLGPVDSSQATRPISIQLREPNGRFSKAVHGTLDLRRLRRGLERW